MSRDRAAELRDAFDRGFAQPPAGPAQAYTDRLRIRVGGAPYALPVAEIASLHVDLRIEPVPSGAATLLGVATIRSAIVAVHDLRALLGITGGGAPRWVVLARDAVAFAFDSFDGLARVVIGTVDKGYPVLDLSRVLRKEA
jgi:chemotaxis signal transduction protein